MVLFCDGTFHAPGFRIAMSKPWKCEAESLKRHSLKDNVYQLMFRLAKTTDRALHNRPWNLDEKLIILRTCDSATQYPPSNFESTYFNYRISSLPAWSYTSEIGR